MRFIHTGDIHYGMTPDVEKPWAKERATAVKESLRTIVSTCSEQGVDLLLIAGDLFHHQPLSRELKEVDYLFSQIPTTHVVIVAGNHDCIRSSSGVLDYPWSPNVHYITSEELSAISMPDIKTDIIGFSYHTPATITGQLDQVRPFENGHIQILLAHCGDPNYTPINPATLGSAGFTYCALGHIHKPEQVVPGRVIYCGSPEPLDMTETGKHGYFMGDINPETRQLEALSFVPSATVQYISLVINVSENSTNGELLDGIEGEIKRRGESNIYRLKIKGQRDPDIDFDLSILSDKYRIAAITDTSEPKYDYSALLAEHSSDVIGLYIQELDKPENTQIEQKALYYGVNALLHTVNERSEA